MGREPRTEDFEGLVISTTRMFARQVRWEEDDLAQELRMKVWHALKRYDPTRSKITVRAYVFGAVTNRVKDLKRDAARESQRREDNGISIVHIEGFRESDRPGEPTQETFDNRYHFTTHEQVFGQVDEGLLRVPSTLTEIEVEVLMLLMSDWSKAETALFLGLPRWKIDTIIRHLRLKLADWEPTAEAADVSSSVADDEAVAA